MATLIEIGTLLDRNPKIRGGRPKIAGTGITVARIVIFARQQYSPEEIAEQYPHINLAQVHAALAYYHSNREEIDTDLAETEAWDDALEKQHARQ